MSKTSDPTSTALPLWIAAGCLVAGVLLFFGNTMPALAERDQLDAIEDDLAALRNHHDHAIQKARLAGAGSRWEQDGSEPIDLQSLFVAIDQKGYTISEFCEAWPVEPATEEQQAPR